VTEKNIKHVVPLNDDQDHYPSAHCLCAPTVCDVRPMKGSPQIIGLMIYHHPFDCRPMQYEPEYH